MTPRSAVLATITPAAPVVPEDRGRLLTVAEIREEICRGIPSPRWVRDRLTQAGVAFVPVGRERLYYEVDARRVLLVPRASA